MQATRVEKYMYRYTVTVKFYIYIIVCKRVVQYYALQPYKIYNNMYECMLVYIHTRTICIHNCIQLNTVGVTFTHTHAHTYTHMLKTLCLGRSVHCVCFRSCVDSVQYNYYMTLGMQSLSYGARSRTDDTLYYYPIQMDGIIGRQLEKQNQNNTTVLCTE